MSAEPSAESSLLNPTSDSGGNSGPGQGLVTHNVTAVRAEPNGASEQISQAIVGDTVVWLDEQSEWVGVRTADEVEGWIWRRHLSRWESDRSAWPLYPKKTARIVTANTAGFYRVPGSADPASLLTRLPIGAKVLASDETCEGEGRTWRRVFVPLGPHGVEAATPGYLLEQDLDPLDANRHSNTDFASWPCAAIGSLSLRFLGTPYLWGGTTPFGFDCSGFVQRVYSLFGVILPRDAYLQARSPLGRAVEARERRLPGDLLFFCGPSDPKGRGITHVGMVMNQSHFIHAAGKEGVILTAFEDPYYSQRYADRGAWRLKI